MPKIGTQGYLGEIYIRNDGPCDAFTKVALITTFGIKKEAKLTDISTVGQLKKDDDYRKFEAGIKTWSVDIDQIYLDKDASQTLLSNAIDKSKRIFFKLIPKRTFGANNLRTVFIGLGLVVGDSSKNPISGNVSKSYKILGTGPLQKMIEKQGFEITCNNVCSKTEYRDVYESYSCSGVWSVPFYISTGPGTSSPVWTQALGVAKFYKSTGFFHNFNFAITPPTTQTTTPPPTPTIAILSVSSVIGKTYGNYSLDISYNILYSWIFTRGLPKAANSGFSYFEQQDYATLALLGLWVAGEETVGNQLKNIGYSTPFGLLGDGIGSSAYWFMCCVPATPDTETIGASPVTLIPPGNNGNDCLIDSLACTFAYRARVMLVNGQFNQSLDFLKIIFYSDAAGTIIKGTFTFGPYTTRSGLVWTDINLGSVVPYGSRYFKIQVRWLNPNGLGYIYGYIYDGHPVNSNPPVESEIATSGMRFIY